MSLVYNSGIDVMRSEIDKRRDRAYPPSPSQPPTTPSVTARKDDAIAGVQAAIANVSGLGSASGGAGLIQSNSG